MGKFVQCMHSVRADLPGSEVCGPKWLMRRGIRKAQEQSRAGPFTEGVVQTDSV